jgi:hypothetical protein
VNARAAIVLAAATLLAGCNAEWVREYPFGCRSDEQGLVRDTLYFGASIPAGGAVDAAAWSRFENEVLTPAFPRGYSVIDANGKWRGNDGVTIGEASRVVVIIHVDDAASASAVRAVARTYQERFHQEAVLRERSAVCGSRAEVSKAEG